ncbi:MAG: glycosyltransferase family 39 protein [Thermoleophilia bacterium]
MPTTLVPARERELPALPGAPAPPARRPRRLPGLLRGPASRPAWSRPALLALLAATAVLYLWDLGASGWGNQYYAAAAQAGSSSWKALLFGALDPGNAITVDKPPASIWVMGLSVRAFGLSSWSLLVPQALMGVASVGLLHATVRRVAGPAAGLAAGAALALTPVATLMFRFDNPDALLVLLLVAAAYALTRALERASTGWLLAAGSLVGWAFLAKMLQAFLVVPAFALVYLVAAPTPLQRRLWQLVAGGVALVASAGWWVVLVELWPAASRPYVGGSTNDSVVDLVLGYNGLSRLTGEGDGPGGGGFSGTPGAGRLFNALLGGEVSWLLPAAGLALVAGLVLTRRRPRTDRTRAALLLWGGWLVVTGAVLSLMDGIVHPYYAVALAPAVGALVGIGGRELWRARRWLAARAVLALGIAGTTGWSWALLDRTPDWQPWLRYASAAAAAVAIGLVLDPRAGRRGRALLAVAWRPGRSPSWAGRPPTAWRRRRSRTAARRRRRARRRRPGQGRRLRPARTAARRRARLRPARPAPRAAAARAARRRARSSSS